MLGSNPVLGRAFLLRAPARRILIITATLLLFFGEGGLLHAQTMDKSRGADTDTHSPRSSEPPPRSSEPRSKNDAGKARQNYQELKNSNPCNRQPAPSWCK
jgi:hypothetical protein